MKRYYIFIFLCLFFLSGCLKEEKMHTEVRIAVRMPDGFKNIPLEGIEVKLSNVASGLSYHGMCDASGVASLNVEYGFYGAEVQSKYKEGTQIHIFNGSNLNVVAMEGNTKVDTVTLSHALKQQLVIKEIYYSGCLDNNNKNYLKDQYVSVYNNSDEPAYLDSLCMAIVNPATSSMKSNFVKEDGSLMDILPLFMMAWQFPGSGQDHLVNPGEEVIISINAINHEARHPKSVDLSHSDFAFYHVNLSLQEPPAAGVISMTQLWKGSGTGYTLAVQGPAVVLFKIPGNAMEYASNAANLMQDPVTQKGLWYLMIHKDWVLDGVECVQNAAKANKRLTDNIDAGFIYNETQYQGLSVHRKVESIIDGRITYMDSNNSAKDMEIVTATLKN